MGNEADVSALDRIIAGAQTVWVSEVPDGRPVEIRDPIVLQQLRMALRVSQMSDMDWMSADEVRFQFRDGSGAELATVGFATDDLLRWQGWDCDALVADPQGLLHWLAGQGITKLLQQQQDRLREREREQLSRRRWEAAIPAPIADRVPRLLTSMGKFPPAGVTELSATLLSAYPGAVARISRLLSWYGSGSGLASGYPSYEDAPIQLLDTQDREDLVQALELASGAAAAGAARYLGSWGARDRAPGLISALSPGARARMCEAAQDETTRKRLLSLLDRLS